MPPSRIPLVVLGLVALSACNAKPDDAYPSSCPQVEEWGVAESYQAWTEALAENDHYRFVAGWMVVEAEGSDPMDPSFCTYATRIEVVGHSVIGRELILDQATGPLADSCEPGWSESGDEVGQTVDERAHAPIIVDDVYETCCAEVFLAPDGGGFDYFYTQEEGIMASCGDDYCDDGGCVSGTDPDVHEAAVLGRWNRAEG